MKTKKEVKTEYKLLKFKMGVYQIRNQVNGKIFIGSSLDLVACWNAQKFQLDFGLHQNSALQADWKTFGSGSFIYEILEELTPSDEKKLDYRREVKVLEDLLI
jgi:hypothetical protein